jgi:acyl-homoserine lactone synthase
MWDMIEVVTKDNAHLYGEALEEMFRLRHEIYVKERNWVDLDRPDGLEKDQFDGPDATYLLAFDDNHVSGCVRLLPTTGPHLLGDVFPHLCEAAPVPRSEEVFEITRLCAHRDFRQPGQGGVLDKLVCGLFEHALSLGLRHMSMVTDAFLLAKGLQFGWKLRPLGLPAPYREGTCIACVATVDRSTLDGFYKIAGIAGPVLNYVGIPKPSVDLPGEHVQRPASLH